MRCISNDFGIYLCCDLKKKGNENMEINKEAYPHVNLSKVTTDSDLHMEYLGLATFIGEYLRSVRDGDEDDAKQFEKHIGEYGVSAQGFDDILGNSVFLYDDLCKFRNVKRYRKNIPTRIRVLTQEDFDLRGGVIHTLESKRYPFVVPGDYLAKGAADEEWVMSKDFVLRTYDLLPESRDAEGFDLYIKKEPVRAVHLNRQFRLIDQNDRLHISEKRGGWMVWNEAGELWICADHLFYYDRLD